MKLEFPCAVREIPVANIDEAVACYQGNLGLTLDRGGGEPGLAGNA